MGINEASVQLEVTRGKKHTELQTRNLDGIPMNYYEENSAQLPGAKRIPVKQKWSLSS